MSTSSSNFTQAVAGEAPPLLGEEDAVAQARALRALQEAFSPVQLDPGW